MKNEREKDGIWRRWCTRRECAM